MKRTCSCACIGSSISQYLNLSLSLRVCKNFDQIWFLNSGKTHTMAGTPEDPGLMVLSLQSIFALISKQEADYEFEVTCSYLEVYNEVSSFLGVTCSLHLKIIQVIASRRTVLDMIVSCSQVIYDLLERSSGHLELREDPDQGITVAGLKRIKVIFVV